jgi:glycosyltransferase involved in cell wall biosynthesis
MGHLRAVKDPFRTALAAELLPAASRVQVLHLGGALSDDMAEQARKMAAANPRYRWLGELPWSEAMKVLSRCHLMSLTSELEGGANVISEAVMLGVPVVSSRIAGSIGLLGEDYPAYFPVHDTQALADLLWRAETDAAFYQLLSQCCAARRSLFEPTHERETWQHLLAELFN